MTTDDISPWFHKTARILGIAATMFNRKRGEKATRRVTAEDLGCNAAQLRQVAAKRYRGILDGVMTKEGMLLVSAEYERATGKDPAMVAITYEPR